MNARRQQRNWFVDFALFAGLLICFLSDLTGISVHQGIGIAVGLLAVYHLVAHWVWIKSVSLRLFKRVSRQTRVHYLIDAGVMLGLLAILATGMVISTWFDLPVQGYYSWKNAHVIAAVVTLALVVLKIGLHWRWIVAVAHRSILPRGVPASEVLPQQATAMSHNIDRREFLQLMGVVGVASVIAIASARQSIGEALSIGASPQSSDTDSSLGQTVDEDETDSGTTSGQAVRCHRGCSYPGHCRRYVDSNSNGRCDLGEYL